MTVRHFESNRDLIRAIKKATGPIMGKVMAGGGCDPLDIKLSKRDVIAAISGQGDYSAPPFYILTKNGCTYLCADHNH